MWVIGTIVEPYTTKSQFYYHLGRTVLPRFLLSGWKDRLGGMKQPPQKSTQCLKPTHRIWWADANFLLVTGAKMCYNIPVQTVPATVTPEKPGSTTCRAVITILPSADSSMRILLQVRGRGSLDTICFPTVIITLAMVAIPMAT